MISKNHYTLQFPKPQLISDFLGISFFPHDFNDSLNFGRIGKGRGTGEWPHYSLTLRKAKFRWGDGTYAPFWWVTWDVALPMLSTGRAFLITIQSQINITDRGEALGIAS